MKILKVSETEVYEVIEEQWADNAASYTLKVNRFLSEKSPTFAFNDEIFFVVSIGAKRKAVELTELEFGQLIQDSAQKYWNEVADIELRNGEGNCFVLPAGAVASRSAYAKTHGISNQSFITSIYSSILEQKKAGLPNVGQ